MSVSGNTATFPRVGEWEEEKNFSKREKKKKKHCGRRNTMVANLYDA